MSELIKLPFDDLYLLSTRSGRKFIVHPCDKVELLPLWLLGLNYFKEFRIKMDNKFMYVGDIRTELVPSTEHSVRDLILDDFLGNEIYTRLEAKMVIASCKFCNKEYPKKEISFFHTMFLL